MKTVKSSTGLGFTLTVIGLFSGLYFIFPEIFENLVPTWMLEIMIEAIPQARE